MGNITTGAEQLKKYNFSLDIMKSMAMFLVVFYHLGSKSLNYTLPGMKTVLEYYGLSFCAMGVPIFFFVNGALAFGHDRVDWTKWNKKTIKVFLLIIVWSIVLSAFMFFYLRRWGTESFIIAVYKGSYVSLLWFLKSLAVCYILFPLLFYMVNNIENKRLTWVYLTVLFAVAFGNNLLTILINVMTYLSSGKLRCIGTYNFVHTFIPDLDGGAFYFPVGYFVLGGIVYKRRVRGGKRIKGLAFILLLVSMLTLTGYGRMHQCATGEYYNVASGNYDSLLVVAAVFCLYLLLQGVMYNPASLISKYIKLLGQNTLGVYLLHIPIGYCSWRIIPMPENNFIYAILFSMVVLNLSLAITLILKKIPVSNRLITM